MKKILLFACGLLVMTVTHAQIIHVPSDYSTIQAGINAANPGDTVLVADGTYPEQISFLGKKPLVVASLYLITGDASHISNTIIDGSFLGTSNNASLVTFISGEDTTSVLCGFTIQHGKGTLYSTGGSTYRSGGGIFISSSGARIIHNHITDNNLNNAQLGNPTFIHGAGIGCEWKQDSHWIVIENNMIDQNSCSSNATEASGAGISVFYNCRISGNTISGNTCTGTASAYAIGGGINCSPYTVTAFPMIVKVENNVITDNLVTAAGNYAHSSASCFGSCSVLFSGNTVENNSTNTYALAGGGCALLLWIPQQGSVVLNNTFKGNTSNVLGAVAIESPIGEPNLKTVLVENNYFLDNSAKWGGAFSALEHPVTLQNNVFSGNHASQFGGALYLRNENANSTGHLATLMNNSFFGNKAFSAGGAIYTGDYRVRPLIINSVFWGDTATQGAEIYLDFSADSVEIAYSNINDSLISGHYLNGGGNIKTDPHFADLEYLSTPSWSPVVDTGTASYTCAWSILHACPQYDILGVPRPFGRAFDMGAYDTVPLLWLSKYTLIFEEPSVFPNPFTNSVTIRYRTGNAEPVLLRVFDNNGRLVEELVNTTQLPGSHKVTWNAENLPAGIYYCQIQAGNQVKSKKMIKIQ